METIKGKISWIDMVRPSENDLTWLRREFKFHPVIMDELRQPSARARVEAYDNYLYFIYQFPFYDEIEKVSRRTEIDILITKNAVITVHYENNHVLNDFKKKLQNKDYKEIALGSTLQFTYRLIESILVFNQRQLHHIQEKVEQISAELFKDKEKEILELVSYVKRDLSEYRIIFHPQGELLQSLVENGIQFWGATSRPYVSALVGDHLKLVNQLEGYRAAISDLESTNNQLMNVKNTQVMQRFTVLAFFTFPLMLIANIFSMRAQEIPFVENPNGFWIVLGIMASVVLLMLVYFRSKKWL